MKKATCIVLALMLLFALMSGCGGTANQPEESSAPVEGAQPSAQPEDTQVVLSLISADAYQFVINNVEPFFTERGYQYSTLSADGSTKLQIEQIENASTQGADLIIVLGSEPESLTDVCQRVMDRGTYICCLFQNTYAWNVFRGTDVQYAANITVEAAAKWIDETFPDAADGTVEVGLIMNTESADNKTLTETAERIAEFTSKAVVVESVEVSMNGGNAAGMSAAENMFLTHPDIKCVIAMTHCAVGVDSFAMAPGSPIEDKSQFAIFTTVLNPSMAELIRLSANNESTLRGGTTFSFSLDEPLGNVLFECEKMLKGEPYNDLDAATINHVTLENIDEYY